MDIKFVLKNWEKLMGREKATASAQPSSLTKCTDQHDRPSVRDSQSPLFTFSNSLKKLLKQ